MIALVMKITSWMSETLQILNLQRDGAMRFLPQVIKSSKNQLDTVDISDPAIPYI